MESKDNNVESIELVEEFQRIFGHTIRKAPDLGKLEEGFFRYKLLIEEVEEYKEAIVNRDLVGVADALTDIQYILDGTYLVHGLKNKKAALLLEVHRSNMSKACKSVEEAEKEIDERTSEFGPDCYYEEKQDEEHVILYRNDGKVLKGPHYFKPNLKAIIEHD